MGSTSFAILVLRPGDFGRFSLVPDAHGCVAPPQNSHRYSSSSRLALHARPCAIIDQNHPGGGLPPMSWKEEVEGIELRQRAAAELGGAENVEKQHLAGRLTVRERIDALLDAGSFREQGPIAGYSQRDAEGKLQ